MAWRLAKTVIRGKLDNRERGRVRGEIWLIGKNEPIIIDLAGNCYRDLAGSLLKFENPEPGTPDNEHTDLALQQIGVVGDITASRKVRVFDIPVEDAISRSRAGEIVPEHLANSLYLEWFGDFNGRVVVESADFRLTVSEPEWTLSEAEELQQRQRNSEEILRWMQRLGDAFRDSKADHVDDADPP